MLRLFGLVLVLFVGGIQASTIKSVSVEDMLAGARLVFEGRVIASRAYKHSGSRMIVTEVRFAVDDVLKGAHPGPTLTLKFLGGTAGGRTLNVDSSTIPEGGEHGVFFVEQLGRNMVNPFFGWSQGYFRVRRDARGVERVTASGRQPVTAVGSGSKQARKFSNGIARGIAAVSGGSLDSALTLPDFKTRLRDMLRIRGQ